MYIAIHTHPPIAVQLINQSAFSYARSARVHYLKIYCKVSPRMLIIIVIICLVALYVMQACIMQSSASAYPFAVSLLASFLASPLHTLHLLVTLLTFPPSSSSIPSDRHTFNLPQIYRPHLVQLLIVSLL